MKIAYFQLMSPKVENGDIVNKLVFRLPQWCGLPTRKDAIGVTIASVSFSINLATPA